MAKNEQMLRLKFIEELLRRRKEKGASYKEIEDFLQEKFNEKGLTLKFTERTFLRDKVAISDVFGISISYSRQRNIYFIEDEELELFQESVFDQLLLVEAYRQTKGNTDVMFFEHRRARGLEHLHGIIHAITNKKVIKFNYQKFWENEKFEKLVEPYALKEFKNRWYLLAADFKPKNGEFFLKTFGLDRISDLEITSSTFKRKTINIEETYKYFFGIINATGDEPQEILLKFDSEQANYVKALKLHNSQTIVSENAEETVFRVFLVPTYDFQREILSYGNRVKIISPESFKNQMKAEVEDMLKNFV
ncbi:Predicted DNA-binding transcriptional regulator YafY, contains an HTH and WYL domains [Halpernia humi]|uniref:Predicted DNA-binding transcriptional regulator YafY, contains an HTH and WYL domains n=1 Tax=Halpernia humi TaxID=493375 RepID=A0A1H5SLK9_9FLAO|nr:WYL domain-containing protein [Halpernia humi]SEF51330.1 Predicted DNA-binding transcriptional regulator YafY, contains an HTH and WYL domains [Halpernia humi]